MRMVLGLDPGQHGGLAAWSDVDGEEWKVFPLPMQPTGKGDRKQLDLDVLCVAIREYAAIVRLAVVEVPPIIPTNGSLAIAGLHRGYGEIRGLLKGLGIKAEYVPAAAWMKVILPGKSRGKGCSIAFVRDRFPQIDITKPPKTRGKNVGKIEYHDGLSDAVCLAEFGRRQLFGS